MRTLLSFSLALGLAALAASLGGSAVAAGGLTLSIGGSGSKVLYGHDLALRGRLSNGLPNRTVSVYSRPIGRRRLDRVASVRTGPLGGWSLRVAPAVDTVYEARSGTAASPLLSIGVEPVVVAQFAGGRAVAVRVLGGRSFAGRVVELQRAAGTGWATIATAALDQRSAAVFRTPLSGGAATLRVAMSVNQAGRGYLGAQSHSFVYRPLSISISLSAPATLVRFGRSLELSGRLSSGLAGKDVIILARRYGSPTVKVASLRTRADGRWTVLVKPTVETTYDARWNGIASPDLGIGVEPSLSLAQLASNRLAVRIAPAARFIDQNVELQGKVGGRWKTIAQSALTGARGGALFAPPAGAGAATLRAAISVNEAGAGYLGATSAPLAYHARFVSLVPAAARVLYGHSVLLSGRTSDGKRGERVAILAWPYGRSAPREIASVLTGNDGRWSLRRRPSIQTSYTARWGLITSRVHVVGVEPRISVARSSSGRIATHIAASSSLADRTVQLQELTATRGWTTIARARLSRKASAVLLPPALSGRVTLRVALSVNQAGAGLLGATSHPFGYRSV